MGSQASDAPGFHMGLHELYCAEWVPRHVVIYCWRLVDVGRYRASRSEVSGGRWRPEAVITVWHLWLHYTASSCNSVYV